MIGDQRSDYLSAKKTNIDFEYKKKYQLDLQIRKILSSMGTMEAIEFLLSKLRNTKNNADFFVSMNKPS